MLALKLLKEVPHISNLYLVLRPAAVLLRFIESVPFAARWSLEDKVTTGEFCGATASTESDFSAVYCYVVINAILYEFQTIVKSHCVPQRPLNQPPVSTNPAHPLSRHFLLRHPIKDAIICDVRDPWFDVDSYLLTLSYAW